MVGNWMYGYYVATACLLHLNQYQCTVIEGPSNVTYLPGLTPLPIELTCNIIGVAAWRIDNETYTLTELTNGDLPGHSRVGTNILVNSPMNNTEYICVSQTNEGETGSDPAYIIIAGVPVMVPDVTVDVNTININVNIVTLTLSWGEPFNNLDPIVNYTVSCSGDVTCPPDFTTTDNTTRSYTITNLTPMTNYKFSVIATNSIGSGEAGVVMITPPAIGQANITSLSCQPDDLNNQCVVSWELSSQESVTFYQFCYYLNSTEMDVMCVNVSSSTMELTFVAPTLSIFNDAVVVTVTIFNQFGKGPASDPRNATIYVASSVITATPMLMCSPVASQLYNITVTCTIHPDSRADQCVVMAMADDGVTRTGIAPITDGMAIVIINNLQCGVMYNITTEGALNGTLVGPGLPYGIFAAGPCPVIADSSSLSTGAAVAIGCVITLLVSVIVTAIITAVIMYMLMKRKNESTPQDNINKVLYEEVTSPSHTSKNDVELQRNPAYGARSKVVMDTNPAYESYK